MANPRCGDDQPTLAPQAERAALLARPRRVGYTNWVEEERCDAYRSRVKRLRAAGWDLFYGGVK